jgi:hypothetical protein
MVSKSLFDPNCQERISNSLEIHGDIVHLALDSNSPTVRVSRGIAFLLARLFHDDVRVMLEIPLIKNLARIEWRPALEANPPARSSRMASPFPFRALRYSAEVSLPILCDIFPLIDAMYLIFRWSCSSPPPFAPLRQNSPHGSRALRIPALRATSLASLRLLCCHRALGARRPSHNFFLISAAAERCDCKIRRPIRIARS